MKGAGSEDHRLVQTWIPNDLADLLAARAEKADRSVAAELRQILRFILSSESPTS